MNATVDATPSSLVGRQSVFDCNIEELKQLVNEYPYFAPAKFLLAKKMKEKNSFLYEEQIQRASIYFQNPLWLDHVLQESGTSVIPEYNALSTPAIEPVSTEIESAVTEKPLIDQVAATQSQSYEAVVIVGSTQPEADTVVEEDTDFSEESSGQTQADQPSLDIQMPKFTFEPVDPSKNVLTFEPYHTVDYFASQGIKAKEEEKSKDTFTRQLKSFTEWIRVMKRLPESEIAAAVSATDEKKVEKMAEVSIHDREVVTEAMAEVWEKQGNKPKALETYRKLSLLNPGKSAYFAAKIDHLKNL